MLQILTDEQISPAVVKGTAQRCRGLRILAMQTWEDGHYLGTPDEVVLKEAARQQLTLVTYDRRTIPPLLRIWGEQGLDHGGVVLVDERTIAQNDLGGLIRSLCALWKAWGKTDWTNRVVYLRA